jgi:hypothetical protein
MPQRRATGRPSLKTVARLRISQAEVPGAARFWESFLPRDAVEHRLY